VRLAAQPAAVWGSLPGAKRAASSARAEQCRGAQCTPACCSGPTGTAGPARRDEPAFPRHPDPQLARKLDERDAVPGDTVARGGDPTSPRSVELPLARTLATGGCCQRVGGSVKHRAPARSVKPPCAGVTTVSGLRRDPSSRCKPAPTAEPPWATGEPPRRAHSSAGCEDGRTDGWTDSWTDRQTDGWTDR